MGADGEDEFGGKREQHVGQHDELLLYESLNESLYEGVSHNISVMTREKYILRTNECHTK